MTTVQKREGSRKLQPDQNSLQQQLLRSTASDRALLVVAADRAMARIRKGKRKADSNKSADCDNGADFNKGTENQYNKESTSDSSSTSLQNSESPPDSKVILPGKPDLGSRVVSETVVADLVDCAKSKHSPETAAKPDSKADFETDLKVESPVDATVESNVDTTSDVSVEPTVGPLIPSESRPANESVVSAQLLERATDLAPTGASSGKNAQTAEPSKTAGNPVALSQLLTRSVDEIAQQSEPAVVETVPSESAFDRQETIDQQIPVHLIAPEAESPQPIVSATAERKSESVETEQVIARSEVSSSIDRAAVAPPAGDPVETFDDSTADRPVNPGSVSTASNDASETAAIPQAVAPEVIPAIAPYNVLRHNALRRPRKRCGGLDHRYIQSSAVKSRRALAWDDLRFRYGLLPTVKCVPEHEADSNATGRNNLVEKNGASITPVRRPNLTRRKTTPAYVNELARLDADPALGLTHKNPFEIHQLELPLRERKPPVRERRLNDRVKFSRPTHANLVATTDLNRKLKNQSKWWLLSQTVLQRTSVAMIFLALMIAGIVLFQEPVVEKRQSMQEITTLKAQQNSGGKKDSVQSDSGRGEVQRKTGENAAPPAKAPERESFMPQVNIDSIASEEIIDLVGQIEIAENLARVPRLPRNPASGLIFFDPMSQPVAGSTNVSVIDRSADLHLLDESDVMVAQINPVIRSYLGPARAVRNTNIRREQRSANSKVYAGIAIDRHPDVYGFEVRLSQQSMEIFNSSILAGDHVSGGREIAYLGVADALGKNTLSFSMSPMSNRRIDVHPVSRQFDLAPMQFFKFENQNSRSFRSIMVELDKSISELPDKPTAMESPVVRFDKVIADTSLITIP